MLDKEDLKNELITKVFVHQDEIDFRLEAARPTCTAMPADTSSASSPVAPASKQISPTPHRRAAPFLPGSSPSGSPASRITYDPTCRSSSLLLRVAKEVGDFCGSEMNPTTYNLAQMNLILHGVYYRRSDLNNEDALSVPRLRGRVT